MPAIISLFSSALLMANPATSSNLVIESCDFGETYAFAQASCDIPVSNNGDKTIRVTGAEAVKPGDAIAPHTLDIAPHATAYLHAEINAGNAISSSRHDFALITDEAGSEKRNTNAHGFVMNVLNQSRPTVDFGIVDAHAIAETKQLVLESRETPGLHATQVLGKPPYVDVDILPDGRTIAVKLSKNANWGIYADYVKLALDSPRQSQAWFAVKADIRGDVLPASNPFDLGLMRVGNANRFMLSLSSPSGKDFKVGSIKLEGIQGEAKVLPCAPQAVGCRNLSFSVPEKQLPGAIQGAISLELPEYAKSLRVAVWGLLLAKDTKVHSMDEVMKEREKSAGAEGAQPASTQPLHGDLGAALQNAVQKDDEAPPAGKGPLLKWSVANEIAIHGYQIFRSSNSEGPFELLNRPTVATKNSDGGSNYQYRDNTAESGKTYWYYIGVLYNDGRKQQLSGPQKVVAK